MSGAIDPIRLEVVKNALLAVTDEMSGALQRSSYSTNIKTRGDFSCALLDADARVVAQSFSQPTHLGSLVHSVPSALAEFGADRLAPGDGLIINDPHRSAVHLNDIAMISPVDVDGVRIGYVANVAHHVDIGGSAPGSLGINSETYQEGLVIPPILLMRAGSIDEDVARLIRANVRSPRECLGDFRAQAAANLLASRRMAELCDKIGIDQVQEYLTELLEYADRRVAVALKDMPNGVFEADDFLDDDGITDDPIPIAVKITIDDGTVTFDLTGCGTQVRGPMNATPPMTYSGVAFVLKTLLPLDIPVNDGFYRHVNIVSTPGTVVAAQHPAAVAGGWEVAFRVAETALHAMVDEFPDIIPAATKGIICNVSFGGRNPANGEYYTFYETIAGGFGAHADQDGMDGVQPHIHNTENAPVEETELHHPVRIAQFSLIQDSGGAGTHRGGLGVRRDYWFDDHRATFSIIADRSKFAPWGSGGGLPGRKAHYVIDPDGDSPTVLGSKATVDLEPGQIISVQTPGGGGAGDPKGRDPDRVRRDVALGKVSAAAAREVYGVETNDGGAA